MQTQPTHHLLMAIVLLLLMLSSCLAGPYGDSWSQPAPSALPSSPFALSVAFPTPDGGQEEFSFDVREGEGLHYSLVRFASEVGRSWEALGDLRAAVVNRAREVGAVPVASFMLMGYDRDGNALPLYHMNYYNGEKVDERTRAAGRDMNLTIPQIKVLTEAVESVLDQLGWGPERRPFPCGTVGSPDPQVGRQRTFRRIRVFEGTNRLERTWFSLNAQTVAHAVERHAASLGRALDLEIVSEVLPDDYDSLYIILPFLYPHRTPLHYIVMQLEQLDGTAPGVQVHRRLRGAMEVWEYSLTNVKHLRAAGVPASSVRHVPLGFIPSMSLPHAPPRTYDVIFFGRVSGRRMGIIPNIRARLEEQGLSVRICDNSCFGPERYEAYVSINVHSYDKNILEVHRILPLIANRVYVVSEPSDDTWYDDRLRGLVDFCHVDQIPDRVAEAVHRARVDPDAFEALAEQRRSEVWERWSAYPILRDSGALDFLAERVGTGVAHYGPLTNDIPVLDINFGME